MGLLFMACLAMGLGFSCSLISVEDLRQRCSPLMSSHISHQNPAKLGWHSLTLDCIKLIPMHLVPSRLDQKRLAGHFLMR